jgi:lysophospholipase L1-like esterase
MARPPQPPPAARTARTLSRGGRFVLYAVFSVVLVVGLLALDAAALEANNPVTTLGHHYYLALGNSLSFGFQPNLDFTDGFADDVFTFLQRANVTDLTNFACAGETTTTMIEGGCIGRFDHHGSYFGAQLDAAIAFLQEHPGRVSPITLEIGSNDVLPDWNIATCSPNPAYTTHLDRMDHNLTQTILPELIHAVETPTGIRAGGLHLLNYYNPFARACPDSALFVNELNAHLAADAAPFGVPVIDVYAAFGGDAGMAGNVCGPRPYTWICDAQFHDPHPTTLGYQVIAHAVELGLGLPGTNPLPGIPVPGFPDLGIREGLVATI